jgi:DNA-binding XRE family transcriptional regulator
VPVAPSFEVVCCCPALHLHKIIVHYCENFKDFSFAIAKNLWVVYTFFQEDTAMTIGERILQLRKKRHMTQSALAKKADVPVSTISMLEAGVRKGEGLTVDTAKRIARALVVTLDHLTGMYEEEEDAA